MHKIIRKADAFALFHHGDQKRKYTNEPYIVHPRAVSYKVMIFGGTKEMIAAAILHDVVEDTDATHDDIQSEFGTHIADFVYQITDIALPGSGNRKERATKNVEHISNASNSVKTIKICDILDNAPSIIRNDPSFAKVWIAEKKLVLPHLFGGNKILYRELSELLGAY